MKKRIMGMVVVLTLLNACVPNMVVHTGGRSGLSKRALDLAIALSAVGVGRRRRRGEEDGDQEGRAPEQPLGPHGLAQQRHGEQRGPQRLRGVQHLHGGGGSGAVRRRAVQRMRVSGR